MSDLRAKLGSNFINILLVVLGVYMTFVVNYTYDRDCQLFCDDT